MAFEGILKECNRLALEHESREKTGYLKSRLASLELEYEGGHITEEGYMEGQQKILAELQKLAQEKSSFDSSDNIGL